MVAGIVVTHGELAEQLLATAKSVFGEFAGCYPVSNSSKSPQALYDELVGILDSIDNTPAVVFVDFAGGSCGHPCLRLDNERSNVKVVSGVNLPMLIAFLNKRDTVPFEELPDAIVARGHNSIRILNSDDL